MEKYIYCLLLAGLCATACKNKPEGPTTEEKQPETAEKFTEFFGKFKTDSAFQYSRVRFPVVVWSYFYEPGEDIPGDANADSLMVIDTVRQTDYSFLSFEEPTNLAEDNYKVLVAPDNDTAAKIIISGVDNGINITFYFENTGGQWFLTRVEDLST